MESIIKKNKYIYWLLFLFVVTMTYLINILGYKDISAIVFFITSFFFILSLSDMNFLLKNLIVLNFLLSFIYSYHIYVNSIINFPDTLGYFNVLSKMINSGSITLAKVTEYAGTLHVGYHYLNYFIFTSFDSEIALYLVNIFMLNISILLFHYHLKGKYSIEVVNITTGLLIMSRYLMIFTSNLLKDSLILFLSMLSLYMYDKYIQERKLRQVLLIAMTLSFLTMTRIYSGVGIAAGILIDYFILNNKRIGRGKILIFIAIIVSLIFISPLNSHMELGIRFLKKIDITFSFFIRIIKSTISFFLSPLFWNMTKELTIYTPIVLDSIFLLLLSPLILNSIYKVARCKDYRKMTYIYYVPILIHILALGTQYDTGAVRQRIAVYPFVILLYVLELSPILMHCKTTDKV